MSKKKPEDKLAQKRAALIARTALILGVSETEATTLLRVGRHQSLRINPLKGDASRTLTELRSLGWEGESFSWIQDGYTLKSDDLPVVRDSAAVAEGRVFIQNASSWLPVIALDAQPSDTILDVCAAPGGKTSHIAALTHNKAHIVANDNSYPRLAKMRSNFDRLGVKGVTTTLYDATQIKRKMEGQQFDRVLLDAPCSGEGMMQLDRDKDLATWSVAHIKRLQQLQKKIIIQAWQLLKPGGTFIYSTCTMAPEENEAVVDYLLRTKEDSAVLPIKIKLANRIPAVAGWNGKTYDEATKHCLRLKPSRTSEAFFVCKLQKSHSPS